jgi:LL-diaminopimelate aminotransferase
MWKRRQSVFFNGVSYPVQRAAEAALSQKGREQCRAIAKRYMANTCVLGNFLRKKGIWFTGGESSPYIWMECPGGRSSGEFFDFLLATTRIVGTPGAGFGRSGEGYFRFSCFATEDKVAEAVRRMDAVL